MKRRIGLYGGTFDPIHFGHLTLSIAIKEAEGLDEIWVIPAHCSPLRIGEKSTNAMHRYQMVRLAVEDIPGFHVLDIEIRRPAPSYTLDTVKELLEKYPGEDFFLILAEDLLLDLPRWQGVEKLIDLIPLIIGKRAKAKHLPLAHNVLKAAEIAYVQSPVIEISATMTRERLKKGLYCGHLVPTKVLDYISINRLYYTA